MELSEETVKYYRNFFKDYDVDDSGTLSKKELKECLPCIGTFTDEQIDFILEHFDVSGDGKLSIDEIVNNLEIIITHSVKCDELVEAFRKFDKNGDGNISYFELLAILKHNDCMSDEEARDLLKEMMKKYDKNFDGRFNYLEFVEMYESGNIPSEVKEAVEEHQE